MIEETLNIELQEAGPSRSDVSRMFDRISRRYDFLNHFLSLGLDFYWRKKAVLELPSKSNQIVLDLACGTADLMLSALKHNRNVASVIGIDPASAMLGIGCDKLRRFDPDSRFNLALGDGHDIPVMSGTLDAAMIAFGIRNMVDVDKCLSELHRILKSGGRLVILEFSLPANVIVKRAFLIYLRHILPKIGGLISGDNAAYRYLNQTIETFYYGKEFCHKMSECGFNNVQSNQLSLGIVSVYVGDKI